jgi:hypothetical protein
VRPRTTTIHSIHNAGCCAPKMWIFCFSPWTIQSSSFRLFNPSLPKPKPPAMWLHLTLSCNCSN